MSILRLGKASIVAKSDMASALLESMQDLGVLHIVDASTQNFSEPRRHKEPSREQSALESVLKGEEVE